MSSIKVISFDLDDTLWDNLPVLQKAEQAVFDFLARQHPPFAQQFDLPSLQLAKQGVATQHPELTDQISELRIVTLEQALRLSGYSGNARELAEQAFSVFIHWRHQVTYLPQVESVLSTLSQDYRLAALTNGNADIQRLSIARYFDYAQSAEQLGAKKPELEYYQKAIDALAISPSELIHIGDHPEHDVAAARTLGIHTIWIDFGVRTWPEHLPPAKFRATTIEQIPALIAQIKQA